MKSKALLLIGALLVFACGVPAAVSTPTFAPLPSGVPFTEVAPPVVPNVPQSQPATAAASQGDFRDDFEGALAEGWTWKNEDSAGWSMSAAPGSLQITAGPGHIANGDYSNLLLRPAPSGNFSLETKLTFAPVANFQFAGLVVYESDGTMLQVGRAFCRDTSCAGDGLYFDNYFNGQHINPNFSKPFSGGTVYLRLERQGSLYTFSTSTDGSSWSQVGQHQNDMSPVWVGLMAGQSTSGTVPAVFDFFAARSLP